MKWFSIIVWIISTILFIVFLGTPEKANMNTYWGVVALYPLVLACVGGIIACIFVIYCMVYESFQKGGYWIFVAPAFVVFFITLLALDGSLPTW